MPANSPTSMARGPEDVSARRILEAAAMRQAKLDANNAAIDADRLDAARAWLTSPLFTRVMRDAAAQLATDSSLELNRPVYAQLAAGFAELVTRYEAK